MLEQNYLLAPKSESGYLSSKFENFIPKPIPMEDREKIRILRMMRGYTQEYMAYRLHIAQNSYSKIELGQIKLKIEMKEDILRILETTSETFDKFDGAAQFTFHQQQVENAGQIIHPTNMDSILKIVNEVTAPYKIQVSHLEEEIRFLRNLVERKN